MKQQRNIENVGIDNFGQRIKFIMQQLYFQL